ncbi:Predicted DNA-binding transcriptional regulator YafY, contains an HTH and WYL domains [Paenibacillus sp. UNCCL117]|nr:Predicted DNA-binding transcriptional regulator YafY, contains an HTH and WYL domains [Paenibacillus sp. cl123]SFW54655.1 Predicted DNA-binding transcriptional regulator YafY, contains an HTH and WYL domains [Paenibacillus sp. UNCCL117]
MRFINNRAHFTIAEIQREFKISRATAIRDINEIQAMGFPLTTELGRGGGYNVLQNQYLSAVRFTPEELKAIFISFIASKNSQLPYLQNRRSITEKLIGIASQTQHDELIELNNILLFENTNPANPNLLELDDAAPAELNQLISLAARDKHLRLTYEPNPGWPQLMDVFVIHIFNSNARWLVEVYDLDNDEFRYLPVEMLRDSAISKQKMRRSEQEILSQKRLGARESNLIVKLDTTGILRFKRLHPPGIILSFTGMFQSSGIFNAQLDVTDVETLEYYADWLLFLGKGVEFERIPDELRLILEERLRGSADTLTKTRLGQ